MNLIFVINERLSVEEIDSQLTYLKQFANQYNIIIKIVSNEFDLNNFDSYKNSYSSNGLKIYQKFKNSGYIFNFDIYQDNQLLSFEDNEMLFFDIYIDNQNKDFKINKEFNKARLDLNIIDDAKPLWINKQNFKNIDYYYSKPEPIFDLKEESISLLDYLAFYKKTIIYMLVENKWSVLGYGVNRFKSLDIFIKENEINPQKEIESIKKKIILKANKNTNCSDCLKIKNCIDQDLFFYFNQEKICYLK